MVYLARKNGAVIHHTDMEAMKTMDGIGKAEMEISDEEFEAAGSLARIIDGKIFIGKTDEEKQRDDAEVRIRQLKAKLAETDYIAAKSRRAVRPQRSMQSRLQNARHGGQK